MMEMLLLINLDMKLNWCGQDKNNHVRVSQGGGVKIFGTVHYNWIFSSV